MSITIISPGSDLRDQNGVAFTGVYRLYYTNAALGSADGTGLSCNGAYIRYDVKDGVILNMYRVTGTNVVPLGGPSPLQFQAPLTFHCQYIYTTNYDSEGYKCYHTSLRLTIKDSIFGFNLDNAYLFYVGAEHDRIKTLDKSYADCNAERATLTTKMTALMAGTIEANKTLTIKTAELAKCEDDRLCLAEGSLALTNALNDKDKVLEACTLANKELTDALNELVMIDRTGNLTKCLVEKECLKTELAQERGVLEVRTGERDTCNGDLASRILEIAVLQNENASVNTRLTDCNVKSVCLQEELLSTKNVLQTTKDNLALKIAELVIVNNALEVAEEVVFKTQLEKCMADYECLQGTATDLKTTIIDKDEEIRVLKYDKNNLELALTFAQELDYQNMYTEEVAKNKCLKEQLMITSNNLKDVLSQLANCESQRAVTADLIAQKDIEANKLKSENTDNLMKLSCCNDKVTTLRNTESSQDSVIKTLTDTNQTLTTDLQNKDKESNDNKTLATDLKSRLDCADTKIDGLRVDLTIRDSNIADLTSTNQTLTSDLKAKDKEANDLSTKSNDLTERLKCSEVKVTTLTNDLGTANSNIADLTSTNQTLTSDLKAKDKEANDLSTKSNDLTERLRCANERITNLQKDYDKDEIRIADLLVDGSQSSASASTKDKETAAALKTRDLMQSQLACIKAEYNDALKEIEKLKAAIAAEQSC